MVGHKTHKRVKRPIETSLGQALSNKSENDLAQLRRPIDTNITGLKQVLSLLDNATNEVKNYVMHECDIIYECRYCRSIFRSLANFILHKRKYCKEMCNRLFYIGNSKIDVTVENVTEEVKSSLGKDTSSLDKIIERLHKKDKLVQEVNHLLEKDLTNDPDSGRVKTMDDREKKSFNSKSIILERIDSNDCAVFQTVIQKGAEDNDDSIEKCTTTTKSEVMENFKKLQSDVPVLDNEGKVSGFTHHSNSNRSYLYSRMELSCNKCAHKFVTQKSLSNHIKSIHNPSRMVFVCPSCKGTFANPWCVYRHLLRVHRMTNKQVRRMREQIHNNGIRRSQQLSIQKKKAAESSHVDRENQWINNIEEDNAFQMCAGCGKRFERKAALHSHSQMCAKRLEVCNNIRETAKKKGEEEALEKVKQDKLTKDKPVLRGASKRKVKSIYMYDRSTKQNNVEDVDNSAATTPPEAMDQILNEEQEKLVEAPVQPEEADKNSSIPIPSEEDKILNQEQQNPVEEVMKELEVEEKPLLEDAVEIKVEVEEEVHSADLGKENEAHQEKEETTDVVVKEEMDNDLQVVDLPTRNMIQSTKDLLCSEVSFETFFQEVGSVIKEAHNPVTSDDNEERDVRMRKRKAEQTVKISGLETNNDNFLLMAAPYMDRQKLACMPCVATFKSHNLLLWHMSAHFSWFRYQCAKCSFVTFSKFDCLLHLRQEHTFKEQSVSSFILPLPNWKTLLMSHDFRLLKESHNFGGKHTDEDIQVEDANFADVAVSGHISDISDSDSSLFGDGPRMGEDTFRDVPEKENVKRGKFDRSGIDLDDGKEAVDAQQLPEPVELGMPVDASDVFRMLDMEESAQSPEEPVEMEPCEDSCEDWCVTKNNTAVDALGVVSEGPVITNSSMRPCRVRTKPRQNKDFLYYDADINNVLKIK